jgi:uncharacterized oxidoreductase
MWAVGGSGQEGEFRAEGAETAEGESRRGAIPGAPVSACAAGGKRHHGRMRLAGKRVLVTGGASGIGLALAQALAAAGARVGVCGRSPARLADAARQVPGLWTAVCDVRREADVAALADRLRADWAGVDVVVNNAGVGQAYDLRRGGWLARAEDEIATNLLGALRVTARFLPELLERPEAAIVNVTSGFALVPSPAAPGYSAAKAGLRAFTRALRRQLRGTAVRVVEVLPPMVDTPLVAEARCRKMAPAAVAAAVVRGLARDRREIAIGETRWLRGGARWLPGAAEAVMTRYPLDIADLAER